MPSQPAALGMMLAGLLVIASLTYWEIRSHARDFAESPTLTVTQTQIRLMEELHDTWQSGTTTVSVRTRCGTDYDGTTIPGETPEACKTRHEARVAEWEELYPRD